MFSQLSAQALLASTVLGASIPQTLRLIHRPTTKHPKAPPYVHTPINHSKGISEPLQNVFQGTDLQCVLRCRVVSIILIQKE